MNEAMARRYWPGRDEQIERGLPPEDAPYAALRRFGNVTRHLERFRGALPWFWLEVVWRTFGTD